ncbi:hypothetical protein BC938DRAFT_478195 [Jimgerdemannia flammicorona]|uniref:Uncharacterized protein n=1 Tax=Jimgerdemannia flammicorona TaxID=994334 RepID=A0A433QN79_9FUNG|nr:hypothetical protein BC938DRAFT_478195 [Jimgerdemannia flammicorona]
MFECPDIMEKNPLDGYFKAEKYRFLGYYLFRQKQRDFTSNFRLEAQRLSKCLWFLSEHGSNVEKRAARRLLDNFEANSMEGPVKSREGVNTSMTMVDACVPSTLWRHSLSRHGPQGDCIISCGGGVLQESREGVTLTQLWRVPARHLTLRRSLDPVVVCLAGGDFLALLNVL